MLVDRKRLYIQQPTSTQDDALRQRLHILLVITLIGLFILLARTWHLQIIQDDYFLRLSENNRLRSLRTKSLRGKILDRYGHILADNRASYTLMSIPEDLSPPTQLQVLLRKLDIEVDLETLRLYRSPTAFKPVPLHRDVSRDRVAYFAEHRMDFPGLFLEVEPLRFYPHGSLAAHLIGHLGEISETQLQRAKDHSYQPGDLVGQYGLEHRYESTLHGQHGIRQVEVDAFGREIRLVAARPTQPGINLVLTLDLHLQQLAEKLLQRHAGAIIAMDPQNGQILALASNPAFDPNMFAARLSEGEWSALTTNPKHPLHNRAFQGQYPPGSIFKIITALAALEEGTVTPSTTVFCPGHYVYRGHLYRDWKPNGHGFVDLRVALSQSCDVYFYRLGQELGVDRIAQYGHAFGLGQISGFAPGTEKSGLIPSTQWKRQARGQPWYSGETLSVAIGQGYTLVTPLQAVNMMATLANGGTLYKPYVILRHEEADGTILKQNTPTVIRTLNLNPQHVTAIRQGLLSVVQDPHGTGKKARHDHIDIAGKTGTAQVVRLTERHRQDQLPEAYRDHAWFIAFAPFDTPQIAVVIMIEHAGKGGSHFAGYAKTLIQAYLQRYPIAAGLPDHTAPSIQ
ncbi:MAG: penicillin-binding protein 2 [bacterium]|nr:penicillin-binding protein 2 [bacterium]